jgi:predicted aconitase with swiveling domain
VSSVTVKGRVVVEAEASGLVLVGREPLSFWGGYDARTGEIIDRRHPLSGQVGAGRVLAVPFTRGSSTTAQVLLESVRNGTAPAAILTAQVDSFIALASIVADELYRRPIPIVVLDPAAFAALRTGQRVTVARDGTVTISDL